MPRDSTKSLPARMPAVSTKRTGTPPRASVSLTRARVVPVWGSAAAAGLSRLMGSILFAVSPVDPLTYGVVAAGLLGATAVASYVPARRVARVDPVEALRAE